jgi:alpha-beta hydrolase superfamily lysophospholipase
MHFARAVPRLRLRPQQPLMRQSHSSSSTSSTTGGNASRATEFLSDQARWPPLLLAGAVLQAPLVALVPHLQPPTALRGAAGVLAAMAPGAPLPPPWAHAGRRASYHPDVAAARTAEDEADPLFYRGPLRAGTAMTLLAAADRAAAAAGLHALASSTAGAEAWGGSGGAYPAPLLVQHGSEDAVCDPRGSEALVAAAMAAVPGGGGGGGGDGALPQRPWAQLRRVEGGHHDLLRERPALVAALLQEAADWVLERARGV